MCYNAYPSNELSTERTYLVNRLNNVFYQKSSDAQKFFGLRDDDPPLTAREIVARIQSGNFVIPDETKDTAEYYPPYGRIKWRDPAKKKDAEGYDKFIKVLDAAQINAMDVIVVKDDLEEGLAALKELENLPVQ